MTKNPYCVSEDETIVFAGRLMRQNRVKALVVNDKKGNYKGLISTRMIADRYISATDKMDKDGSNMDLVAADLVRSLDEKVSNLMETDVLTMSGEDLLKDAVDELLSSKLREAVVLDEDKKKCIGVITRSDVAKKLHKNVVLVDHNEASQAATGIDEANILEIVDHHRIADITTLKPIKFVNLPVGSTASIVASEFENYKHRNIPIPKPLAAALLSAVLTDTIILNSPTTTAFDRKMAQDLAKIAQVDIEKFGFEIFSQKTKSDKIDVKQIITADSKEYQLGDQRVLICQHETVDVDKIMQFEPEIRKCMARIRRQNGYEFVLFMLTDIIKQGSLFIGCGDLDILNRLFDIECHGKGGT